MLAMDLLEATEEGRGAVVVPAAFPHEFVPDLDLLVVGVVAPLEAPIQQLLVGPPLQHSLHDGGVIEVQEGEGAGVEALAEVGLIVLREFAGGVEADFIEHAADVINAANLVITASEAGNMHAG